MSDLTLHLHDFECAMQTRYNLKVADIRRMTMTEKRAYNILKPEYGFAFYVFKYGPQFKKRLTVSYGEYGYSYTGEHVDFHMEDEYLNEPKLLTREYVPYFKCRDSGDLWVMILGDLEPYDVYMGKSGQAYCYAKSDDADIYKAIDTFKDFVHDRRTDIFNDYRKKLSMLNDAEYALDRMEDQCLGLADGSTLGTAC